MGVAHRRIDSQVPKTEGEGMQLRPSTSKRTQSVNPSETPTWYHEVAPSSFESRHSPADNADTALCLCALDVQSLDELSAEVVPAHIRRSSTMDLPEAATEQEALAELRVLSERNVQKRCFRGQGYTPSVLPPVIQRSVLENPGWYTQYTPYQAEIAQGRLELLLNFQTMVNELTGLPVSNASLLDESTAAAEAMALAHAQARGKRKSILLDNELHPQNITVVRTRSTPLGVTAETVNVFTHDIDDNVCAVVVQVPNTQGIIPEDLEQLADRAHKAGALVIALVDPLAQCILRTPGDWGADVAVGSTQRFGLPMGFGGPHAGFMAVSDALKRRLPGRIIGVSVDRRGEPAYRLALQTREQHIRREKATSNICTAQVLPAILSVLYVQWHGPKGLQQIAMRTHRLASAFRTAISEQESLDCLEGALFDTVSVGGLDLDAVKKRADDAGVLLRFVGQRVQVTFDETSTPSDISLLLQIVTGIPFPVPIEEPVGLDESYLRSSTFLPQSVFHSTHTEHEMLRYLTRLQNRDLSLAHSMIPLGSCTMKLNATAEMIPVTWKGIGNIHPFADADDVGGYLDMCDQLSSWLSTITELPVCSLQPNAGSQGEYAGLVAIREWHLAQVEQERTVCLIPESAHGTNPASAVMVGMRVVAVACDDDGNVDLDDLRKKAEKHSHELAALMVTYPSTHGVFETAIRDICALVHEHGGQVYMDGANMNAQVGLTSPGAIGADVCHLNLHKTFCIPHGGGGPGMGPICAAEHLRPHMPTDPQVVSANTLAISSTHFGSASILVISWMYIRMMGPDGLKRATQMALMNANYMAKRLEDAYPVLFRGDNKRVAHEFILDLRALTKDSGLLIDDIAKRLMDYGFHAPTMSWPVAGTLMIEPTESESKGELDRFCEAMLAIRSEIQDILDGKLSSDQSPLHFAPHTAAEVTGDEWPFVYTREQAVFPLPWVCERKFWPYVSRVDNTYGDRNLVCSCEWDGKYI